MPPVNNSNDSADQLVKAPVYQQLTSLLRDVVTRGEVPPGRQFLTERQICERFGVSRVTANKALSHLVIEGVLEFRKGVGTFVQEQSMDYDLQSLTSFTKKAELAGRKPITRVSKFEQIEARTTTERVRHALHAHSTDLLYYFERLRLVDGTPVILEKRHVLARLTPGLTRKQVMGSFYKLLTERFDLRITGATQTIRAVCLPTNDAKQLKVKEGAAGLWVHAVGHTHQPVWVEDTYFRGDMYEFRNTIGDHGRMTMSDTSLHGFAHRKRIAE